MRAEEEESQDRPEPVFQAGLVHYELEDVADRTRLPLGHRFGGLHSKVDEVL